MTEIINLNFDWYFKRNAQFESEKYPIFEDFERVQIPHNVLDIPLNYFDEKI